MDVHEVEHVANYVKCAYDVLPFVYLGLPVGRKLRGMDGWKEVIDRFSNRLNSWKSNLLSIGGRLTLVKSVLGSLPLYYLSLSRAPLKVIDTLESIRCRFFWGIKPGEKKIIWVKWRRILLDKQKGGLGVGSIKEKNFSLLGKWRWRFQTEKEALWRKVIKEIYGESGGFDLGG